MRVLNGRYNTFGGSTEIKETPPKSPKNGAKRGLLASFGSLLASPWEAMGRLGGLLGVSWAPLGVPWRSHGAPWGSHGTSWGSPGVAWGCLGVPWAASCGVLGSPGVAWGSLGAFWVASGGPFGNHWKISGNLRKFTGTSSESHRNAMGQSWGCFDWPVQYFRGVGRNKGDIFRKP